MERGSKASGIEYLKGVSLFFALRHERLGFLFSQQCFNFLIQPFSIQRYSPVLWNHPERMVSRVDPLSPHRMGKLVGGFQTGFQFSDLCFNGFFLCFQIYKLCKGILPLRV